MKASRALIGALVVALVLVVIAVTYVRRDGSPAKAASVQSTQGRISEASEQGAEDAAVASTGAPTRAVPVDYAGDYGYDWNPENPGVATSEADAAWLKDSGFPSPEAEERLALLSIDELQSLAKQGNQPAAAMYAYRLARQGAEQSEVLAVLQASASSGSVYALKTAGDIFLTVNGYRDPVMASAYYRMQARAGDQAGFSQNYLLQGQLTPEQKLRSEMLTELLWRNTGGPTGRLSTRESRPGYREFVEQALAPKTNPGDSE